MDTDQTDVVQPEEGQGGGGNEGSAPYADYLERIPEELRGDVEPVFRDWDRNVTQRFQEAAQYRSQWEPYEQLRDHLGAPEDVQALLQFRDMVATNPAAAQEWWNQYAEANGLNQQFEQQAPTEDLYVDPDQRVEQVLDQRLQPLQQQLQEFQSWQQQQEYGSRLNEAHQLIDSQLGALKQEHPDMFDLKDGEGNSIAELAIARYANEYAETDPENAIPRAFKDYQNWVGTIQRSALQAKASQPSPAVSGGVADGTPEEPKTLADARPQAREMIRGMFSS